MNDMQAENLGQRRTTQRSFNRDLEAKDILNVNSLFYSNKL